jgi:hypothetical protein
MKFPDVKPNHASGMWVFPSYMVYTSIRHIVANGIHQPSTQPMSLI